MFGQFVRDARYAALEATSVAAGLGSSSVEAEHLLIAIASGNSKAAYALRDVGLEPQELRDALLRDFERVLGTVGIDASGVDHRRAGALEILHRVHEHLHDLRIGRIAFVCLSQQANARAAHSPQHDQPAL